MRESLFKTNIGIDEKGNTYTVTKNGDITLKLSTGETRSIGKFIQEGDKLYFVCIRSKNKHLMRKFNAYGFNNTIIENFKPDCIVLDERDTGNRYYIDLDTFLNNSKFLNFKTQGFELQRFLEVKYMKGM